MVRFTREVEAVQLDLNEAAEDTKGCGRLGDDLRSSSTSNRPLTWRDRA